MAPTGLLFLCFAIPSLAHKRLAWPNPRNDNTAPTGNSPCGGTSFEDAYADGRITDWEAGSTVEIVIYEEIFHTQQPMRLAISDSNDEDFESCIWLNHIPQHTRGGGNMNLTIELTVPNFNCKNCTLQLMAFQTGDFGESECCVFHPNCEEMYGDLGDDVCCATTQYFSCANININGGSRSRNAVCKQPNNWGLRDYKCNYWQGEESSNAWQSNNDGGLSLVTSGSISDLDPTADSHCSETELLVPVDRDCHSTISSASDNEEASLLQGGQIKGEGVFAIVVVMVLALAITITYCLTKNKEEEKADVTLPDISESTAPQTTDGSQTTGGTYNM